MQLIGLVIAVIDRDVREHVRRQGAVRLAGGTPLGDALVVDALFVISARGAGTFRQRLALVGLVDAASHVRRGAVGRSAAELGGRLFPRGGIIRSAIATCQGQERPSEHHGHEPQNGKVPHRRGEQQHG